MPFIICRDCKRPAEVVKLAKGKGHYTKSMRDGCQCGTDQRRGEARQKWLSENMKDSIAELAYIPDNPPQEKPPKEVVKETPRPDKKKKSSKLWWLLVPVAGLGILAAKTLSRGKSQ
jgi:hypothetical protein